jgi:membrane-associated phospholipid phosphatase
MEHREQKGWAFIGSQIMAVVFHPVFIPVYGLLLIFNAPTFMVHLPYQMKRVIFMLVAVNMTIVPLALLPLLRYRNIITSYRMETNRERVIPLSLGLIMYLVTTILLFNYQIPNLIKSFMLSATISSFLILMFTFRWKISIHSAGVGGIIAATMALSVRMGASLSWLLVVLIFLSGLVMMSRLFLKVHSPGQVYTGFLVGFIPFILIMLFYN